MRKVVYLLLVLAGAGLLGWQVFQRASASNPAFGPRRQAVAVELAPVRTGLIRDLGHYTGSLQASSQFVIAPRITGRLKHLLVNIGDKVERDQVVVQIVDEEYRLQVEQARAALEVAKASLAEAVSNFSFARKELDRANALSGKKIYSQAELDVAQSRFQAGEAKKKVAQAVVAEKEAALSEAQVRLSYTQIRASWRGGSDVRVVGERFVDEGTMLAANAPIATVLELNPLLGVINVIERDYPRLRLGQEALVTADALPGQTFKGRVIRLAPLITETSRQARVELEIPNQDWLLKPGMFIRAEIEFDRHQTATLVPQAALAKRANRQGVFLADPEDLKVSFVPLKLGLVEGETVEVLEPALSGRVVVVGHHLLEDGSAIVLPGQRPKEQTGQPGPGQNPRPGPGGGPPGAKRPAQ